MGGEKLFSFFSSDFFGQVQFRKSRRHSTGAIRIGIRGFLDYACIQYYNKMGFRMEI